MRFDGRLPSGLAGPPAGDGARGPRGVHRVGETPAVQRLRQGVHSMEGDAAPLIGDGEAEGLLIDLDQEAVRPRGSAGGGDAIIMHVGTVR